MKNALIALALLAVPTAARADYSPPPANDLILASEAIVTGEIVALAPAGFTLRVDEVVAGAVTTATIEVERFEDWTCAARWAPYAVGQRALYFLDAHEGRWRIRSGGGEGEMPIVSDVVYVRGYAQLAPGGAAAYGRHTVHGGTLVGFTVGRAELVAALRRARACFQPDIQRGAYRRVRGVRAVCGAPALGQLDATPIGAAVRRAVDPG